MVSEEHSGEAAETRPVPTPCRVTLRQLIVNVSDFDAHRHLCDAFDIAECDQPGTWFGLDRWGARAYRGGHMIAHAAWEEPVTWID